MRLIPITLELRNVAPNFATQIVLETPDATWSIGADQSRSELGFSCNALLPSEVRSVSLQSVELTRSTMSIVTGSINFSDPLSFTAVLRVPDDVTSIDGHCTLNDGADLHARLGSGPFVQWRKGRISAILPIERPSVQFINLTVTGLSSGQSILVQLDGVEPGMSRWAIGGGTIDKSPFAISAPEGQTMKVGKVLFTPTTIELVTCASESGGQSKGGDLIIETYIERLNSGDDRDVDWLSGVMLSTQCDESVAVIAHTPGRYPQRLTGMPKSVFAK